MRYPVLSGLCLVAKETEQGVTITMLTVYKQFGDEHVLGIERAVMSCLSSVSVPNKS